MAADTSQEGTARRRVRVRIACEDVIQMKKRKMTVPWDSSSGICSAPWVSTSAVRNVGATRPTGHAALDAVLALCSEHLGASAGFIVIPDKDIQRVSGTDMSRGEAALLTVDLLEASQATGFDPTACAEGWLRGGTLGANGACP